jgi:hypothetical protein
MAEMICNICKQKVVIRKISGFGNPMPERHNQPDSVNPCHGFYVSGQRVEDND